LPTEEDNSFEHLFDNTNEPPIQPKRRSGLLNAPEDIEEEDPDAHYFEDYEDKEEFIEEIESDDSDEKMEEELDM
jgi:hypothetical protein